MKIEHQPNAKLKAECAECSGGAKIAPVQPRFKPQIVEFGGLASLILQLLKERPRLIATLCLCARSALAWADLWLD